MRATSSRVRAILPAGKGITDESVHMGGGLGRAVSLSLGLRGAFVWRLPASSLGTSSQSKSQRW